MLIGRRPFFATQRRTCFRFASTNQRWLPTRTTKVNNPPPKKVQPVDAESRNASLVKSDSAGPSPNQSRTSQAKQELDIFIRARYPIIYVSTWEEERVEQCLRQIATARKKHLFVWTVT